jgi:glycosyltransferase involved in cell wall biosynthesis
LKLALLSMGYEPYYQFGGSETYVKLLSAELIKNDLAVTVIAGWPGRKIVFEKIGKLNLIRIPVMNFPIRPLWYQLQNNNALLKLIAKMDVVHSNNLQCSILNKKIAASKPLFVSVHGSMNALTSYFSAFKNRSLAPGDLFYLMEYPLLRNLYAKDLLDSTSLIFISDHGYREALKSLGYDQTKVQSKSSVINPGINLAEIESMKKLPANKSDKLTEVTFVGRLFYPKGITYALKAFDVLVNEMGEKNYILNIIGDGPLNSWIKRYIEKNNLIDNVNIKGQVRRDEVIRTLQNSSVLVLPSIYEGCPFVLMEANALGVPLVTFDFDWAKEFVINGLNGFRVQPFDINLLAENILNASGLDSEAIKEAAKRFDIKNTAKKTIQAYEKMLS